MSVTSKGRRQKIRDWKHSLDLFIKKVMNDLNGNSLTGVVNIEDALQQLESRLVGEERT